jgi:hypothetical protein
MTGPTGSTPRGLPAGGGVALAALLAACISVPDEKVPQCHKSSDCDQSAGEVCEEGVCWGDPPNVALAAIIGPPGDAKDLVPAELPNLFIPDYGWLPDLVLGTPVTIRGKVVRECMLPCTPTPVEAVISVTRPSSFIGGPGLSLVEKTAVDGTFALHLPLTRLGQPGRADDPAYAVTITPADRGVARLSMFAAAAEEVPPMRMSLIATQDTSIELRMPSLDLPLVQGRMLSGAGAGLAGYRVVARGRWDAADPESEVSTVAVTAADGSYQLRLADRLTGKVLVRAEPPASRPGAAIAEMAGVLPTASATGVDFRLPANERAAVPISLPVDASDSGGQVMPVDGVLVRLHYEIVSAAAMAQTLRYDVEGTTKSGRVNLSVIPGVSGSDWMYQLRMIPPADSRLASVFDRPLLIGAGGELPSVRLDERVRISGVLLDERGQPMNGVALTARPSRAFLVQLDTAKRTLVDEISATTATTSKTGEFVVWADQTIAGVPARYSLTFQPSEGDFAPSWTRNEEIFMPLGEGVRNVSIGDLEAPEASNVHGRISNPGGRPVAKGRLLIYKLDGSCVVASSACASSAQLIGRGVADDEGVVRISLPKRP